MRIILGIVVGFFIAIGAAYLHDSPSGLHDPATQPVRVVNWDVLGSISSGIGASLRADWNRLTGKHDDAPSPG